MPKALSDRWITGLLVGYSLAVVALLFLTDVPLTQPWANQRPILLRNVISFIYDDGFYYFKIAQMVAQGAGSTFDGLHPTNGYHPLWLLSLVPFFWLVSEPRLVLIAGTLLQGVFLGVSVGLLYQTARLVFGRYAASLAALLWIQLQFTYWMALSGMEYSLQMVGLFAVAYLYLRYFKGVLSPDPRLYLALGLLLSLAFLARLDTIGLAGFLGLSLAWREYQNGLKPGWQQRLLALGLPVGGVCLGYSLINIWLFGHPLPVSGLIKQDWSSDWLARDPNYLAKGWLAAKIYYLAWPLAHQKFAYALALLFGGYGVGIILQVSLWGRRSQAWLNRLYSTWSAWRPLILFSLLQLLGYTLIYHAGFSFQPWYYVIPLWLAVMAVASLADLIWRIVSGLARIELRGWTRFVMMIGWGTVLVCTLVSLHRWQDRQRQFVTREPLYTGAQWVRENLPDQVRIGAWNAGMIGYLSGRPVINLDGLVNSWHYYQVDRLDLCHYWDEMGITYLVDIFEDPPSFKKFRTAWGDPLPCVGQLELIWQGPSYFMSNQHIAAYKINPAQP